MIAKKLLDKLEDNGVVEADEIVLIDDEALSDSCVGVTYDNRAVYDYDKIIEDLVKYHHLTPEEAREHIDFNIIRSLSYYSRSPIVFESFE